VLFRERVLFQFYRKDYLLLETNDTYSGESAECFIISEHSFIICYFSYSLISRRLNRFLKAVSVNELPNYFFIFWQVALI